jgi:epoxyqueuosine reductase
MGRARVDEKLVSKYQITSDLSSCVSGSHAGHGASAAIQPAGLLKLTQDLREKARALGFDLCRITAAELPSVIGERLQEWLALGAHGEMSWMSQTALRRAHPQVLWPHAKSVVMLGLNYGPATDPLAQLRNTDCGSISVYAQHRDYHGLIKGRLKLLASYLQHRAGDGAVKVFVDTAPVMEKPLAQAAGLGWQGKHTNLVSRDYGSWLFLGALMTDLTLVLDPPEQDHCGACHQCLDACPTQAFLGPYRLDARRCISYLTIEHTGVIAHEFRKAIGNRIYGCDDCLAVCPWNKYAVTTKEIKLMARPEFLAPPLSWLARLDEAAFRAFFSGSPIKRIGHSRFLRNVMIAIGNSGKQELADEAERRIQDPSSLIRGAAVWALGQLDAQRLSALSKRIMPQEEDALVIKEWVYEQNSNDDSDG